MFPSLYVSAYKISLSYTHPPKQSEVVTKKDYIGMVKKNRDKFLCFRESPPQKLNKSSNKY